MGGGGRGTVVRGPEQFLPIVFCDCGGMILALLSMLNGIVYIGNDDRWGAFDCLLWSDCGVDLLFESSIGVV